MRRLKVRVVQELPVPPETMDALYLGPPTPNHLNAKVLISLCKTDLVSMAPTR